MRAFGIKKFFFDKGLGLIVWSYPYFCNSFWGVGAVPQERDIYARMRYSRPGRDGRLKLMVIVFTIVKSERVRQVLCGQTTIWKTGLFSHNWFVKKITSGRPLDFEKSLFLLPIERGRSVLEKKG